jgi:hypothetical protein
VLEVKEISNLVIQYCLPAQSDPATVWVAGFLLGTNLSSITFSSLPKIKPPYR